MSETDGHWTDSSSQNALALDEGRRFCESGPPFVDRTSHFNWSGACYRAKVAPGTGHGWMEMFRIRGGLSVTRSDYLLSRTVDHVPYDDHAALGFSLSLSGCFTIEIPEIRFRTQVKPEQLWLRSGHFESIHYRQPAGQVIRGVSLALSDEMIAAWCEETPGRLDSRLVDLVRDHRPCCIPVRFGRHPLVRIATRLMEVRTDTVGGDLLLESLALDLLANILSLDFMDGGDGRRQDKRMDNAIDDAVDILAREWTDPPTIAALSRRVGLNACYLKAGFRRRVGMTIGGFVRRRRMEAALEMLESGGCTVLQTASAVGYANPSHFSAVFKQFYGRLPSMYGRRWAMPV
jgi:AraC-like DNA-binding protein